MQTLQVQIFMENMPRHEQKFGVNIFFNNFIKNLEENNILSSLIKCGSGINLWHAQMNILKVSFEKRITSSSEDIENFISKHPLAHFETSGEKIIAVIAEESLEKRIIDCFQKTLKQQPWSSSISFKNYNCVRPIRKISLKLDKKFLSGQYTSIIFSSLEIYEKFFEEKKNQIYKLMEAYFINKDTLNERIIEENCASHFEPIDLVIEFEKKYLVMPFDLLEKIIEETLGFAIPSSNKCILITEKDLKINKDNFENVMNNKLNDIYILFKRDIQEDLLLNSQKIFLGNNLGTTLDKTNRMKEIAKKMNLNDLDILIDNYYYDLSSRVVQNYPSLKGVIAQKTIENGKIIRNAHKGQGDFQSQSLKALEYIDNVMLLPMFTSTKDPFAIKKQIEFLIEFFHKYNLSFDFGEKNDVFTKKIKNKLKDDRKFLYSNSLRDNIDILNLEPFHLSANKLVRILNIVKNPEKKENVVLEQKIGDLNRSNLVEKVEELVNYIDNNHINPYTERIIMIENFINDLYLIIDIKSLLQER